MLLNLRLAPGLLLLLATHVLATPYWITYEGNDYPENEGWGHYHGDITAQRSLENGNLVIDGRADITIYDTYGWFFPDGDLDPDPGELFIMQWRLLVEEVAGVHDPLVGVTSDPVAPNRLYSAVFAYTRDRVISLGESDMSASFTPGVFHTYEMRSWNMRTYQLFIDGAWAMSGVFRIAVTEPGRAAFGDGTLGATSQSRWDYLRFGVVPEPAMGFALLVCGCLMVGRTHRRSVARPGGGRSTLS